MYVSTTTLVSILAILGISLIFAKDLWWNVEMLRNSSRERTKSWDIQMNLAGIMCFAIALIFYCASLQYTQ